MAKKLIFGYLMLATIILLPGSPKNLGQNKDHRGRSRSLSYQSKLATRSRSSSGSPTTDVYVRIGAHGNGQHPVTSLTVNSGAASDRPVDSVPKSWRGYLPSRGSFDRFMYISALVGTGIAIGTAISTCSQMQTACGEAKTELNPLANDISQIVGECLVIKDMICKIDPALCIRYLRGS